MTTHQLISTGELPLSAGTWTVDPAHSSVGFAIRHLGVAKVRGRFDRFDATMRVGDSLETSSIDATVELASVDTGNSDRDAHLRSPDLIDTERRPRMAFRSTSISGSGTDWTLTGDLTIGDVTAPLTLDVEFGGVEPFPGGPLHAGFEAHGELRRADFGLEFALPAGTGKLLGDVVRIELDVQFLEPSA